VLHGELLIKCDLHFRQSKLRKLEVRRLRLILSLDWEGVLLPPLKLPRLDNLLDQRCLHLLKSLLPPSPVKRQGKPLCIVVEFWLTDSGSAWTAVAGFAPPAPLAISPTTAAQSLSLLQIQEQEKEYLEKAKKPTMRSLAEIIEQEEKDRKQEERTAAEVEYDRWLQQEIARNEGSSSTAGVSGQDGRGRGKSRGRGQRKVPNRGTHAPSGVVRDPATVRIDDEPVNPGRPDVNTPAPARGRGGGRGGRGGARGRGGPPARGGGFNGDAPVFQPAATSQAPTHRA